jgi:3-hydroxymyristoyl/3-hydroxydecanoyl-(acyl carrier protein) dehydratase
MHQGAHAPGSPVALDRGQCLEFAVGSIARVLGPAFADVDSHPTRVRLPDEPLMLVDRILSIDAQPRALLADPHAGGRVLTEHDVLPGAWYLDGGRAPTCVAVEAGQADLFLSGYLGIDFLTRGRAVYRLLDAAVTFHRGLPCPGEVIRYDVHIDRFFRQDDTRLFRFRFEGTVNGKPLLTMTDGCAGFFTTSELAAGAGIVQTELDRRPGRGSQPDDEDELVARAVESYSAAQIDALRRGDLAGCFGASFRGLPLRDPMPLPGGRMKLVDRVTHLDPCGGRFGIGLIRAEADVDPSAWFLTCHFVDDQVMPGTLMYECCLHTLRIFLMRLGWVGERGAVVCEPVPGVTSRLKCRGQVTATTRTVAYEVTLKERGYRPEPYALVDALMFADGKPIVEITNMSLRLSGLDRAAVAATWRASRRPQAPLTPGPSPPSTGERGEGVAFLPSPRWGEGSGVRGGSSAPACPLTPGPSPPSTGERGEYPAGRKPALFDTDRILAFAVGKPSEAFGEPYRIFDEQRVIARLPGPPYQFLDRITAIEAQPWKMVAGGAVEAQYDVPEDAWYFAAARDAVMPFAVLLEVALQPCGWLAAYVGSALTSPVDLAFRNLGGAARLREVVRPDAGTLTTSVRLTHVSASAGMILQDFAFAVRNGDRLVYEGTTTFGFFTRTSLGQQVGIRDARVSEAGAEERGRGRGFDYPRAAPFPADSLRMIDRVDLFVPDGGLHGLGFIQGVKAVDAGEWFFKAHFHQDPVCPGSLGLESLLQLLKVVAHERWHADRFEAMTGRAHEWLYRGQVIPGDCEVTVQAVVTARDDGVQALTADGYLLVDGRVIYRMKDFTLRAVTSRGAGTTR